LDCKICKYKVVTPIDEKTNIVYTEENCDKKDHDDNNSYNDSVESEDLSSIPLYMRDHILYLKQLKDEATAEAKNLTTDAINIFSKSNPIL
jgi:hypothetical protein